MIGAGIAGLNALFVAKQYLPASAKVALIDGNHQAGGMWNNTYDYVRLHQPHAMFTAGDIHWTIDKPRDYLATGREVQAHLAYCLEGVERDLTIDKFWSTRVHTLNETGSGNDARVEVVCAANGVTEGAQQSLSAKQVIDAKGLDVPEAKPLQFSSSSVVSTTPQEVSSTFTENSDVYVVGGGKTGMDTVLMASNSRIARKVSLIAGKGTLFTRRNSFFPTGLRRYYNPHSNFKTTIDIAMRFDGTNAADVFEHFRDHYTVSPNNRGEQYLSDLLSSEESQGIEEHVHEIVYDYLIDVVDTHAGPEMRFQSGARQPVEPGAIFVNCTGYVFRHERPETRLLSPEGKILSITSRAAFNFLPSVSAYFLTHLLFSGRIRSVPFYVLDNDTLLRRDRKVWHMAGTAQALLNALLVSEALPFEVFRKFGLDFDRWHPIHKRLAGLIDVQLNRKKYVAHCRNVLDQVATQHGVMCEPLS